MSRQPLRSAGSGTSCCPCSLRLCPLVTICVSNTFFGDFCFFVLDFFCFFFGVFVVDLLLLLLIIFTFCGVLWVAAMFLSSSVESAASRYSTFSIFGSKLHSVVILYPMNFPSLDFMMRGVITISFSLTNSFTPFSALIALSSSCFSSISSSSFIDCLSSMSLLLDTILANGLYVSFLLSNASSICLILASKYCISFANSNFLLLFLLLMVFFSSLCFVIGIVCSFVVIFTTGALFVGFTSSRKSSRSPMLFLLLIGLATITPSSIFSTAIFLGDARAPLNC